MDSAKAEYRDQREALAAQTFAKIKEIFEREKVTVHTQSVGLQSETPNLQTEPIKRPFLKKRLARQGDWCGCCATLMPTGTQMIGIISNDGNRWIAQKHLKQWIETDQDKLQFQKPRGEEQEPTRLHIIY